MFDLSNGVETDMAAGLPPGLDNVFDIEESDLDDDYCLTDEEPAAFQTPREAPVQIVQENAVKAYLVKRTSYNTCVSSSNTRSAGRSLMKIQPARDYLVHLYWRDIFLSI